MKFPNLAYKCPGQHACPGGTFDYLQVKTKEDLEAALDSGWSSTLQIACGDGKEPTEDTDPPTREEILRQCDNLGIHYKKSTPSKNLLELIKKKIG